MDRIGFNFYDHYLKIKMSKNSNEITPTPAEYKKQLEKRIKTKSLENQIVEISPDKLARSAAALNKVTLAINAGTSVIEAASGLKDAVTNFYDSFEDAKEFAGRHRKLELLIVNATKHRLVWDNSFFDSGTTFVGPTPFNVFPVDESEQSGAAFWTVANSQGSFLSGVSGAGKWKIEGTKFALIVGFTNPQVGSLKSEIGVVGHGAQPRLVYDACDNANAKQYDMLGYTVSVYTDEAQAGGDRRFVFCITENQDNSASSRGDVLEPGEYLTHGEFLMSQNGQFAAYCESEYGNLVVHDLNTLRRVVWSTGSSSQNAVRCGLNAEGLFAVLDQEGRPAWRAPALALGGHLQLTNLGALSLFDSAKKEVWTTQTPK